MDTVLKVTYLFLQLDPEKSTVPLDMTMTLAGSMSDEALKFGNFQKSSILQGLQEYLNMSRMGKDHYDRDTMVHEFYYAILMCSEVGVLSSISLVFLHMPIVSSLIGFPMT